MARNPSTDLTEAELRIMEIVWQEGKATVPDVMEALAGEASLAYNTVLTMMTILERKGYLRHTLPKTGRAFIYHPKVDRKQASRNAVGHLLRRFFGDSAEGLVLNLIEDKKLSDAQLKRVRELLRSAKGAARTAIRIKEPIAPRSVLREFLKRGQAKENQE
jgi:predicted transcriptional regulator